MSDALQRAQAHIEALQSMVQHLRDALAEYQLREHHDAKLRSALAQATPAGAFDGPTLRGRPMDAAEIYEWARQPGAWAQRFAQAEVVDMAALDRAMAAYLAQAVAAYLDAKEA